MTDVYQPVSYNVIRRALEWIGIYVRKASWLSGDPATSSGACKLYISKRQTRDYTPEDLAAQIVSCFVERCACYFDPLSSSDKVYDCYVFQITLSDSPLDKLFFASEPPPVAEVIEHNSPLVMVGDPLLPYSNPEFPYSDFWFQPNSSQPLLPLDAPLAHFNGDLTDHVEGWCNNCGASTVSPLDYFCDACEELRASAVPANDDPARGMAL